MFTWVFDFDGVLANTMAPLVNFLSNNLNISTKRATLWVTGYSMNNKPSRMFRNLRKFQGARFANYLRALEAGSLLITPVIEIIKQLPGQKYVMTSNYDGICSDILGENVDLFEDVISFDDVPNKTAGLLYLKSKHQLNLDEVIFLTDTIGDILEFQKALIPKQNLYAVNWGYHSQGALLNFISNDQILKSYAEILTIPTKSSIL